MQFQSATLAGEVGQALVLKDYPDLPSLLASSPVDAAAENARLNGMPGTEIFGRCVVRRDPVASLALFASRPESDEERAAITRLRDDLGPCLAAGSTLRLNAMFLRNAMGVAAFRLGTELRPQTRVAGR